MKILKEKSLNRKITIQIDGITDNAIIDVMNDFVTIYTKRGKKVMMSKEDLIYLYNSI